MFEISLNEMSAVVTVETGVHNTITASNIGVNPSIVKAGSHKYDFSQASEAISALRIAYDTCAKQYKKKLRATHNGFIYAFGPDMMEIFEVIK